MKHVKTTKNGVDPVISIMLQGSSFSICIHTGINTSCVLRILIIFHGSTSIRHSIVVLNSSKIIQTGRKSF